MPDAASKAFERIPIAFPDSDKSKERTTLAELSAFRGKTVDFVVEASVNRHLETATPTAI